MCISLMTKDVECFLKCLSVILDSSVGQDLVLHCHPQQSKDYHKLLGILTQDKLGFVVLTLKRIQEWP